jgi:proteasome alpha subunit
VTVSPFGYVSPEQAMKDRADFARKGIARGRSVLAMAYAGGILFMAENPSTALHKISEIYDRVAFAAVGRYNEFENLRQAGVRLADMRGYSYDRRDVTGRSIANAYAQFLGTIFSGTGEKPYEVELVVAEVGDEPAGDQLYRLTFDGQVADERGHVVMGGAADTVLGSLRASYRDGLALEEALRIGIDALGHGGNGEDRQLTSAQLEVAILDRSRPRRKFRRLPAARVEALLGRVSGEVRREDGGADSSATQGSTPEPGTSGGSA